METSIQCVKRKDGKNGSSLVQGTPTVKFQKITHTSAGSHSIFCPSHQGICVFKAQIAPQRHYAQDSEIHWLLCLLRGGASLVDVTLNEGFWRALGSRQFVVAHIIEWYCLASQSRADWTWCFFRMNQHAGGWDSKQYCAVDSRLLAFAYSANPRWISPSSLISRSANWARLLLLNPTYWGIQLQCRSFKTDLGIFQSTLYATTLLSSMILVVRTSWHTIISLRLFWDDSISYCFNLGTSKSWIFGVSTVPLPSDDSRTERWMWQDCPRLPAAAYVE